MPFSEGKKRLTDAAIFSQILRLIQLIPFPKTEPFKLWLQNPNTMAGHTLVAKSGGSIARRARLDIEK